MSIFELLRADGSIVVNKKLARIIGLEPAIMYSELLSKHYYFESRHQTKDGWFFNSIEDMEYDTCLTAYYQRKSIEKLKELNLIETQVKGMPATRYFKLNLDESTVVKILTTDVKNLTTVVKNLTEDIKKCHLNNTNTIILKNNTKEEGDMAKGPSSQKTFFSIPEKEEVAQSKKKKLTQAEQAQERITSARQTGDWSSVTDTNFTHYYIQRHNEMGFKEIVFNRYESVSIMRDAFIQRHNIPKEMVCDFIDEVLKVYSTHPSRRDYDYLSFNMINKVQKLMEDIMRAVDGRLRPPKKKYLSVTEQRAKNGLKTAAEGYPDDDLF